MMSAPSDTLCRSMPAWYMKRNVTAKVSGIDSATMRPVRRPSDRKLTSSTMATASARVRVNSRTERFTAVGWSFTRSSSRPTGSSACRRCTSASSASPRAMMSPRGAMETATPSASRPRKRIFGCGGSEKPRVTVARSPRRKSRPFARTGSARTLSTESRAPPVRM